jgi:hypothetical protein
MNAKQEFLYVTENKKVKCAQISFGSFDNDFDYTFNLKCGYTDEDMQAFLLNLMNVERDGDEDYQESEVYGYIWFVDGTWCERYSYEDMTWWIHNMVPIIPVELL